MAASKARPSSTLAAVAMIAWRFLVAVLVVCLTIVAAISAALLEVLGRKPSRRRYKARRR